MKTINSNWFISPMYLTINELVHLSHVLNNQYSTNIHHSTHTGQCVYCVCTVMDIKRITKIILMTVNLPTHPHPPKKKISPKHLVC